MTSRGSEKSAMIEWRAEETMSEHEPQNAGTLQDGLSVNVHDEVSITERLGWKKIVEGQKKTAAWGHGRDDVDHDTGRPTWKQLTFDREVDRYTETVTVKPTGEVVIKKEYPLSEKGKRKRQDDVASSPSRQPRESPPHRPARAKE
jgi:hypothetical protein